MFENNQLWIARAENEAEDKICIIPKMANRHGLIAGATGTGKTITLKVLAESFSDCGVPVFLADVKGDLAGCCLAGTDSEDMQKRIAKYRLEGFSYQPYPTCIWDVFGEGGVPLRTTISEMGPTLLARLLDLNQTQSDILSIVFKIADDNGWLILDMKDLRLMLEYVGENAKEFTTQYGNITKQSVGAISRGLISLEEEGGDVFFGEPALDIKDWMRTDENGKGFINVLHCAKLINSPKLYATFLLWMMSELFECMPEAGDADKPKMVFFFDEAHLLFHDAPKALLEKIEQVVKLIRSKGVGIYFITQSPSDVPDGVLAQLGNRIQHALRAYTPADQKMVRAAAQSFRENPEFDVMEVITQLGIGEALVSFLDDNGSPNVVQRCHILPPQSKMGAITEMERQACILSCGLNKKYQEVVDRESAYEILNAKFEEEKKAEEEAKLKEQQEKEQKELEKQREKEEKEREKQKEKEEREREREEREQERKERQRKAHPSAFQKGVNSAISSVGREVTRSLFRGILNTLKKR
ncbi:MAG: helicase HerA-like domain-containing protein [Blautia sp.]|jgi:DNA helicase HerA-like ATPase